MSRHQVQNNAVGLLTSNITDVGTNLVVSAALDSKLSSLAFPFYLTIWEAGMTPDTALYLEVVEVSARPSANNYTIVRAQQSTTNVAHNTDDNVGLFWTKGNADELLLSTPGVIFPYAGSSAPAGYLLCDGASLVRTSYADLFAIIGTTYGSADASHFTLPNLKGKVIVGLNASETEFDTLGETGGEKTHTLITAEIPAHTHTYRTINNSGSINSGGQIKADEATSTGSTPSTASAGSDGAHNNLQPYITLNYIIKY
jgi:microcystin-dependent protein